MNMFVLSVAVGLLFSPTVSVAELYKWTDEQGHLHITDAPPAGTHKKSVLTGAPAPQSASPRRARVQPIVPEQPRAEARQLPDPNGTSPASEEPPLQLTIEGLNPFQALGTSPWQVFDGSQSDAKGPVQSWKDKQGLEHVVDLLPVPTGSAIAGTKKEDVSRPGPPRKGKEQASGVARSRHHATE